MQTSFAKWIKTEQDLYFSIAFLSREETFSRSETLIFKLIATEIFLASSDVFNAFNRNEQTALVSDLKVLWEAMKNRKNYCETNASEE